MPSKPSGRFIKNENVIRIEGYVFDLLCQQWGAWREKLCPAAGVCAEALWVMRAVRAKWTQYVTEQRGRRVEGEHLAPAPATNCSGICLPPGRRNTDGVNCAKRRNPLPWPNLHSCGGSVSCEPALESTQSRPAPWFQAPVRRGLGYERGNKSGIIVLCQYNDCVFVYC